MRCCLGILLLLSCKFLVAQTGSQNLSLYTIKEGLSNNNVVCIKKDSRGFLWIGTQEGLNRFDGYQFKTYFSEKNNKAGLPNDYILDICEFQYGRLLIATTNGVSVLNTLTGQFENDKIKLPVLRAGSGTIINSFYKDNHSNIWINHSGELDLLDSNLNYTYRLTDLAWAKDLKGTIISLEQWYMDKQGRLWLPTDTSGISIVDLPRQKIYNCNNNPQHLPYLKKQSVRAFALDEENNKLLLAAWGEGLTLYDLKSGIGKQELFGIQNRDESRTVNSIIKTGPAKFLFYVGADCYEANTINSQCSAVPERSAPSKHNYDLVNTITLLSFGTKQYWAGTTAGLVLFDYKLPFYNELRLAATGASEISDCTDMIISQSGKLYCTFSSNQLVVAEKNRKDYAIYILETTGSTRMTEVCEDKNGNFWIGTTKGVYWFDTVTKKINPNIFLPLSLFPLNCNVLYCDRDGNIWISTRDPFGLYRYVSSIKRLEKLNNNVTAFFEKQGRSSRISKIQEDKQGRLWMTSRTSGAIISYNKQNDEWKLYPSSPPSFNFLAKKAVEDMFADEKGILWISNYAGDGVIRFDSNNDSILQFNRNDGIQSNNIRSITNDRSGNIWLTSEYGITKFNIQNSKPQSTISYHGFRDPDQQAVFDPFNNSLVFSAGKNLLFLPASVTSLNKSAPSPVIDKISINNEQQFVDLLKTTLQLDHSENNISIDFTAPCFANADKIRFAYMLSGADKDWRYADASRTVQYASLGPGNYTFTIKTAVENGEWGLAYSPFNFTIHPPYWQTLWFQALIFVAAAGIIFLFVNRRIHFIRHEAQLKQQIAETEMMALRAQMNPHFIFNCINSIDAMIQSNDKYHATMYLNKFAKLIRNILDSSKQNLVPLSKDIETLQLYVDLEIFRHRNKFKAEINADSQLLQEDYQVPPLIIQPYVENAILHGLRHRADNNGKLVVNIQKQNGSLHYEITDNGVGRQKTTELKKSNGYGMQICKERIRIFNKEQEASVQVTDLIHNNEPAGTRVNLQLRIQ